MPDRIHLPECDDLCHRLYHRIPRAAKTAFFAAFFIGMLTHLYMFTGKYPNHDEVYNLYSVVNGNGYGRWFLQTANSLSSDSSVPLVTGVLSMLSLSLTCALTVQLFHIEKRSQILLTALIMVSFPTVANTFAWMHTADGFLGALLMVALGVYVTDRYRYGFPFGCALFLLSLMTYQAQICFAVALFAARYLQLLLEKERSDREMLLLLARYSAALLSGVIIYILLARFLLPQLTGEELFVHAGIEKMGSFTLAEIPQRFARAYYEFAQYLLRTSMIVSWRFVRYLHLLLGGLEAGLILWILFRTRRRSVLQTVFALLILALLPPLFNSIFLMGITDVSTLYMMIYSYVMFYLLLIVLYNALLRSDTQRPFRRRTLLPYAAGYAVSFLLLVSGLVNAVNSNELYLALQIKYENSYALANRVVQSVEQYPGYTKETPVYIAGTFVNGNYPPSKEVVFSALARHSGMQGASEYTLIGTNRLFRIFARDYIGVILESPESEQLEAILNGEALAAMPNYPYEGSVAMIDGVLVVKASTPEQ